MSSTPTNPTDHSPIDDFSKCHVGIVAHLRSLGELPALLEPATHARRIAAETLEFFRGAVFAHHAEEELELFPAVLANAADGEERARVQSLVNTLTAEHRQIEAVWTTLEPKLRAVAKGRDADIDGAEINALVNTYRAHARLEEEVFLPLSRAILGRNSNQLAALGLSMHTRQAMPKLMRRFASRI